MRVYFSNKKSMCSLLFFFCWWTTKFSFIVRQRVVWVFNKQWLDILYPKESLLHFGSTVFHTGKETLNKSTWLRKKWKLPAAIRWQIFLLGNNRFLWFPERLNTKPKTRDSDEIQENYLCVFCWKRVNKYLYATQVQQAVFGQLYCPLKGAAW